MDLLYKNYMRSEGHGDTFAVEIDPPNRAVKSYYEETSIALQIIYESRVAPLQLCYSGGLDSEFVLAVCLKLGIPIEPVIMITDYNKDETSYAFKFCNKHNLTPTIINLDFDKFIASDQYLDIAETMMCADWRLPVNMWLAEQLSGTVLTGNDPPHMKLNEKHNLWYLDEEEIIHSQLRFWKAKGMLGTPYFLSYTAEMMLAFLLDPKMEKLANHGFPGKLGTNSTKIYVYANKSDIYLEPRLKRTGYESVLNANIFNHPNIRLVRSWESKWKGTSDHQYHDVVSKLSNGQISKAYSSEFL